MSVVLTYRCGFLEVLMPDGVPEQQSEVQLSWPYVSIRSEQ